MTKPIGFGRTAVISTSDDVTVEGSTMQEVWIVIPERYSSVNVQLNALGSSVAGKVQFSKDRAGVKANSTTTLEDWANGTVTNDVKSASFSQVAGIRLTGIVSNEVVAVPTVTKLTFGTAAPSTGDTVTFGDEVYEFTTDSETELTDPANKRIDMTLHSVTDHTTAAQAFKTVFNAETDYDVVASGAAAVITLTASDHYAAYNTLETTTDVTATATATFEDVTFGGGTGDSTPGVDAVAATFPKLFYSMR